MSFFNFLKFFILVFFSFSFFAFSQQYSLQEVYPGITPIETFTSFYFPDIYTYTYCQQNVCKDNLALLGVGNVLCGYDANGNPILTDKIYRYVCESSSNSQNNCDLSNPYDWSWQKFTFSIFNSCKTDYCGYFLDHYAESCYLKANNNHFIFFTHPNGDFQSRGKMSFIYSTDGQNWSSEYQLLKIASENIKDCSCRGGFTRPSVIYKDGYFYIYFEVWREKNLYSCCSQGIGNQEQFIVRVLGSYTAPYVRLEDGKAEVYKKSTGQWIPMDYDEGHNQFPSIDNMQLDIGYIFGWNIYPNKYNIANENCPSLYGYTYPNGKTISFEGDSLFGNSINDSLGDITLKPNGGCLAIFHTYNDPYNPQYEHSIITRESSDCLNFQEPYVLQNWELTGLTQEQLSHTGPSVFPWSSTSTSISFPNYHIIFHSIYISI